MMKSLINNDNNNNNDNDSIKNILFVPLLSIQKEISFSSLVMNLPQINSEKDLSQDNIDLLILYVYLILESIDSIVDKQVVIYYFMNNTFIRQDRNYILLVYNEYIKKLQSTNVKEIFSVCNQIIRDVECFQVKSEI